VGVAFDTSAWSRIPVSGKLKHVIVPKNTEVWCEWSKGDKHWQHCAVFIVRLTGMCRQAQTTISHESQFPSFMTTYNTIVFTPDVIVLSKTFSGLYRCSLTMIAYLDQIQEYK